VSSSGRTGVRPSYVENGPIAIVFVLANHMLGLGNPNSAVVSVYTQDE
jgi:hypothetical protein